MPVLEIDTGASHTCVLLDDGEYFSDFSLSLSLYLHLHFCMRLRVCRSWWSTCGDDEYCIPASLPLSPPSPPPLSPPPLPPSLPLPTACTPSLPLGDDANKLRCVGKATRGQLGYEDTTDRGGTAGTIGTNLGDVDVGTGVSVCPYLA